MRDVNNYRPISLLPAPSKILEKIVHDQLSLHIEENRLMSDFQYGFRKNRSTMHAVSQLVNHISHNLNRRFATVALYIDFKKAFHCLHYPVLMKKLENMYLNSGTIEWIKDYLTDRRQSTYANSTTSSPQLVK